jgi:uncharacterized membrane protein
MKLIALLILTLICFPAQAESISRETEEQIAKRDVWHAAKLRGVSFRAVGQEPGWLLEITDGVQIYLVTEYGRNKTNYPYVKPETHPDERWTVFRVKDRNFELTIKGIQCADVMSGVKFEVSVFITVDKKKLKGCGRALY